MMAIWPDPNSDLDCCRLLVARCTLQVAGCKLVAGVEIEAEAEAGANLMAITRTDCQTHANNSLVQQLATHFRQSATDRRGKSKADRRLKTAARRQQTEDSLHRQTDRQTVVTEDKQTEGHSLRQSRKPKPELQVHCRSAE